MAHILLQEAVLLSTSSNVREQVEDADNMDFRPRKDSKYIKDDVGPYRYDPNGRFYWIPGRQLYKTSTPVPPDGSKSVKV